MELAELFNKYGSDKNRNGYTPVYHSLFKNLREKPIVLLEIGIGTMIKGAPSSMVGYALPNYKPGGSLRAWRDYFSRGTIHGVDIQPDTQFTEERITTHLCNSTEKTASEAFLAKDTTPKEVDILIDDGAHYDECQLKTFYHFYGLVKKGGFYIIEDVYPRSRIMTEMLPQIREFASDGYVFAAYLTDNREGRTPILVISK